MEQNEKLAHLRHSAAHLLGAALLELYPGALLALGPSTDDGFYYDVDLPGAISAEDLPKIEEKMRELVKSWDSFERQELDREGALRLYPNNPYKRELIEEHSSKGEVLTVYRSGQFSDLCKGGHIDYPKNRIKHFKLLSIAGAYWRGDEKNKMLTRIYGAAYLTKDELEKHLWQLEEAKKRDHKKLGRELELFIFSDLVGSGLPLWTPKGTLIREILNDFVWKLRSERGYTKVSIPHITKKDLYETSGHWGKFQNELFKIETREGHLFAMKPMNCPHHTQIYGYRPRSYKELPQRYAETTMVYRDEQSGELSGLSRVRCITQDDAHVFCRTSQMREEVLAVWEIVNSFYKAFGFKLDIRLSFHDPDNMSAYLGTPDMWASAEQALKDIADSQKATYTVAPGEAAFYGPKIDFMAHDSLNRTWQVATIQLDVNMPDRFNLNCINENSEEERIVMIHCAIMGSIERFMSILIEHFAGAFPLWLAPVQVAVLPVSEKFLDYASQIEAKLLESGIRVVLDRDDKTLGAKIRQHTLQKVPYLCIIGAKEAAQSPLTVSVRTREGLDRGSLSLDEFIIDLQKAIGTKKTE